MSCLNYQKKINSNKLYQLTKYRLRPKSIQPKISLNTKKHIVSLLKTFSIPSYLSSKLRLVFRQKKCQSVSKRKSRYRFRIKNGQKFTCIVGDRSGNQTCGSFQGCTNMYATQKKTDVGRVQSFEISGTWRKTLLQKWEHKLFRLTLSSKSSTV